MNFVELALYSTYRKGDGLLNDMERLFKAKAWDCSQRCCQQGHQFVYAARRRETERVLVSQGIPHLPEIHDKGPEKKDTCHEEEANPQGNLPSFRGKNKGQ